MQITPISISLTYYRHRTLPQPRDYLHDIFHWMTENRLQLDVNET